MLARNPTEAENIWSICQWFKMGSHPTFESGKLARKVRKKGTKIGKKGAKYEPFDETIKVLKDVLFQTKSIHSSIGRDGGGMKIGVATSWLVFHCAPLCDSS